MAIQLFLDCIDRATASSIAFVSFREHPMHFKDNQTLNLRVVDPTIWAEMITEVRGADLVVFELIKSVIIVI